MDLSAERQALRALLDAVDSRSADRRLRVSGRPRHGIFFGALAGHELDDIDVLLLLASLTGRLAGDRTRSGAELVAVAADGSADRLDALAHLEGEAPLLAHALLLPEVVPGHPSEALEARFRMGPHVFRLACEVFGRPFEPAAPLATGPYRTNNELLADLRRLSSHMRRRAARLFHLDPWTGAGLDVHEAATALNERARAEAVRIADRMALSDQALPILALREAHGLDLDALVILVTLLFQEVVEGVAAVDAVDLVKLVSESETDLLRRRHQLRPLAHKGLLRLAGAYGGKELTADASLPEEIVEQLTGESAAIRSDDRIDFHAYLRDLQGSDPFFLDLDSDLD